MSHDELEDYEAAELAARVAYDDDVTSAGFECRGQQRGRVCRRGLAAMLKLLPNPNPRPTPLRLTRTNPGDVS